MGKITFYFVLILLLLPFSIVAQLNTLNATKTLLKEEKNRFFRELSKSQLDPNITSNLKHFAVFEVDSIQEAIISGNTTNDAEKEKALRSLFSFLKVLSNNIYQPKLEMYAIPGTIESYKNILRSLLHHKPITDELSRISSWSSQSLAKAFTQYSESDLLEDVAVYKRVSASPEHILPFLENKPAFRFADSLLLTIAAHDPMKMSAYILKKRTALQNRIRNKRNIYLQQIVSLTGDRNARELMPFIVQLAENRVTQEEIIKKRTEVKAYFQFLVNALKEELNAPADASFIFHKALRNGIKEKSFAFYVNQINEQHSSADAIRFASVKDLRPEDLYYIITSSEDEMYTSSYLGLYKRLMENFKNGSADSLFTLVNYDNFRTFMRIAANYNTLTDFLTRMPLTRAADLIKLFISGIESDRDTGLEKAMDVADSFTGLDSAVVISELIKNEIGSNLIRCVSGQLHFGSRLYNILLQVFDLVKQKDPTNMLWDFLGNYQTLDGKTLQNKNGEIVELVLFYGDEDGTSSFNNFLGLFKDTSKWQTSKNEYWVNIRSLSDQPISIYANLPLDYKQELDLRAQDELVSFLDQQSIEPSVVIHRGHSYHMDKTLKKLRPSVKLAILGSCGGNKNIISVATISPDAQIIVSKKTGSKLINDPMIDVINENLQNRGELNWTEIWQQLSDQFSKDEFRLNLFNEYIPPARNVSLFVLKLFNYYKKFA
ncbi:MAG TPA: hypothetical protein VFT15_11570 [Chitinophagaceae bacterium]|nr:hypothetical protein [Chitinophagaceae bacterium]